MPQLATDIIKLLIGVALFLAGMSMMSTGLKKATGKSIKKLFNKIKNRRLVEVGIGAGVTAVIQSSGATSVMVVGFINAGVMTLFQGFCIILGAYIGTTITGVLVSLSSIQGLSLIMELTAVIGIILSFVKNEKVKSIGEVLIGLGILFVGLEMMKSSFTAEGSALLEPFKNMFAACSNPVLLLIIGALFTCLTQSSSATTGIVIVMVGSGALTLSSGLYIALGATIGTVIVTIIASIGGSIGSKRVALLCLVVRIITAFLALAVVWPIEACCNNALSSGLLNLFGGNLEITVAMFMVFYNVITIAIILPFVTPLVNITEKVVKDKKAENKKKALHFIDDHLLITPTVALGQAKNEINHMFELAMENFEKSFEVIKTLNTENVDELEEREDTIDYINNELTNYLIKLSHDVTLREEKKVGSYFHIINDIERIGDHAMNFITLANKLKDEDLKFSEPAVAGLAKMNDCIVAMSKIATEVFMKHKPKELARLHELEEQTDKLKVTLSDDHYHRITQNLCSAELSPAYTTIVSEFERVADHIVNIGYAYLNPTGDDEHIELATVK